MPITFYFLGRMALGLALGIAAHAGESFLLLQNEDWGTLRLVPYTTRQTLVGNQFMVSWERSGAGHEILLDLARQARPHLDLPPKARLIISLVDGEERTGGLGFEVLLKTPASMGYWRLGVILCTLGIHDGKPWIACEPVWDYPFERALE